MTKKAKRDVKTKKRGKAMLIIVVSIIVLISGTAGTYLLSKDEGPTAYSYEIVAEYPHSTDDFTQGLFMHNGYLYEGTGRHGFSSVMQKEFPSGRVRLKVDLPDDFFGEGITPSGDRLIQLTWQAGIGFVYDLETLKFKGRFKYEGEGWGITDDGSSLIMSNGSSRLTYLDRNTFRPIRALNVMDGERQVIHLNELEFIDGMIYANVWQTDSIAIIDPADGQVKGWIDLSGLLGLYSGRRDVMNGIAVNPETGNLLVTGKLWPKLFEIRLKKI